MPVFNEFSGAWNILVDNEPTPNVVFGDKVDYTYNLDVSPSETMTGSGHTLTRTFGNIDSKITMSGPMLFGTAAQANPYQANILSVDGESSNVMLTSGSGLGLCYDPYWYTIAKIVNATSIFYGAESVKLSFNEQGANVSTTWWFDPPIGSGNDVARKLWLHSNNVSLNVPLRTGNWYDFYYGTSSGLVEIIKDITINISFEYDKFNILGGSRLLSGRSDFTAEQIKFWNHVKSRVLKSLKFDFTITGLIQRGSGRPEFGDPYPNKNGTTFQNACTLIKEGNLTNDVYAWCGDTTGYITRLRNAVKFPGGTGTTSTPLGTYVRSTKSTLVPGLMEYSQEGEFIIPIYGV